MTKKKNGNKDTKKTYGPKGSGITHSTKMDIELSKEMTSFVRYFKYSSISEYVRSAIRMKNLSYRGEYRKQFMFDEGNPDNSLSSLIMKNHERMDGIEELVSDIVEQVNRENDKKMAEYVASHSTSPPDKVSDPDSLIIVPEDDKDEDDWDSDLYVDDLDK